MNHHILLDPNTPFAFNRGKKWLVVYPYMVGEKLYLYTKGQETKPGDICYFESEDVIRTKREGEDIHGHLIVAFPEEIAMVFNGGPPHDRNYNYTNGFYLEVLHPSVYKSICNGNYLIHIEVDYNFEKGFESELPLSPVYFDNKVVISTLSLTDLSEDPFGMSSEMVKKRKTKRQKERELAEKVWEEMCNDGNSSDKHYWMAGFVIGLNYGKD